MTHNLPKTSSSLVNETIAALLIYKKQKDAAVHLKITDRALRMRIESHPEIKEVINKTKEEARDTIALATPRAAEIIVDGLDDRRVKYDMARDILDRAGITNKSALGLKVEGPGMRVEFLNYESASNSASVAETSNR